NVRNALAAASMAIGLGASLDAIAHGLGAARPVAGRLVAHALGHGATLIDDSYNANPGSLAAAIDTLAATPGEGWLVMGAMRELSAAAAQAFGGGGEVGRDHAALGIALATALTQAQGATVNVLVKGSRGSAMDKVVTALLSTQRPSGPEDDTDAA